MNTFYTKEEKDGITLLFLHGWGCDSSIFSTHMSLLQYNCIAIDLWGFGKSDNVDEEGWCVEQYADQLHQWCTQQDIDKVVLVAHSFGARVAMVLSSKYPNMVAKLIITGGAGLRRMSLSRWWKVRLYKLKKFLCRCGMVSQQQVYSHGSVDYNNCEENTLKNTLVKVVNQDLSRYAKKIVCPTLLVWGEDDKETPLWMAKRLNKLIADSYLIVTQGDHFAFANATLFCSIITHYIEGSKS